MAKTKNKRNAGLADKVQHKKKHDNNKKKLNPFEVHINREKIKVLGKKSKHDRGLPGVSRAKAIKKRKETLGTEMKLMHKTNTFIDRRIGERDTHLSAEERMVARFAAERVKQHSRKNIYNLADDEVLTHRGQTLEQIEKFDDPRSDDEDEEEGKKFGGLNDDFVSEGHFGGGILSKTDSKDGAKSHKDLIEQLIAESKKRKAEKQKEKEQTLDLTEKLDSEWKDLQPVVFKKAKLQEESIIDKLLSQAEMKNQDYDKMMRELKFEKRGTPSDGLKTDEKQAKEEREKLEQWERERQQRMLGDDEIQVTRVQKPAAKHRSADDLDDNFELEDEKGFMLAYDKDGKPLVPEKILKDYSVPNAKPKFEDGISDTSSEDGDDENGDGSDEDNDNNKEENEISGEETSEEDSDEEQDKENILKDAKEAVKEKESKTEKVDKKETQDNNKIKPKEINKRDKEVRNNQKDSENDDESDDDSEDESQTEVNNKTNEEKKEINNKQKEEKQIARKRPLENGKDENDKNDEESDEDDSKDDDSDDNEGSDEEVDDFKDLRESEASDDELENGDDAEKIGSFFDLRLEEGDNLKELLTGKTAIQQAAAIQKLIKSYDPSLGENNKEHLSRLFAHMLQYLNDIFTGLQEACEVVKAFLIFDKLIPHFFDLAKTNKVSAKKFLVELLKEKYEIFQKRPKRVPDLDTLIFFKLVHILYPTSDFRHPVTTPSLIFLSDILTLCRFNDAYSVSRGLFVTSLILEYTQLSKRLVPSAINFIRGILYLSANTSILNPIQIVPPFRLHKDAKILNLEEDCSKMAIEYKMAAKDLVSKEISDDFKIRTFLISILTLREFFNYFNELEAQYCLFEPHIQLLGRVDIDLYPEKVRTTFDKVTQHMKETLEMKTFTQLTREKKKPKALRLFEPDIQEVFTGSKSSKLSREAAERARLETKYKKAMKGALREIRRDKAYIAGVKIKQKIHSDNIRKEKVKQIYKDASIQQGELNKLKKMK